MFNTENKERNVGPKTFNEWEEMVFPSEPVASSEKAVTPAAETRKESGDGAGFRS